MCNRFLSSCIAAFSLLLLMNCMAAGEPAATQPAPKASAPTTTPDGKSADQEDGQWLMPAKDYANRRYSGLDQINTDNVKNLKVAWTFSTGIMRGQEAAPL